MDIGRALALSLKIGSGRKLEPGDLEESEKLGWGYGIAGIVLLVLVQSLLIVVAGIDARLLGSVLPILLITLGAPFLIYMGTAMVTGHQVRLPASIFYLGIVLSILQLISLIANSFSIGSTFLLVMTIALVTAGARGFFKLGVAGTIVVGLLTAATLLGAGFLILQIR